MKFEMHDGRRAHLDIFWVPQITIPMDHVVFKVI